jgi:hypothetical protein
MPWLKKCSYKDKLCYVRDTNADNTYTIVTDDYYFALNDGWLQIDKFEWEKTVPKDEVTLLPEEDS